MVSKRVSLVLFILIAVFFSGPVCGKEFIDLFCPGVERKEAILTCAFQAGVEVVFLEPVSGRVNLRKDHVRFEEALSLILKGSGVSWFRANGVYYIGEPSSMEFLRDRIPLERYDLHFVKAEEVIRALPQYRDALVLGGEYSLFVLGEESKRKPILEKIKALDAPKPHILVRALVVEGRKEELEQLGITFPKDTASIAVQEVDLGGPLARLETLKAYLEGPAEEGKVTVRSEAEILVLEGEEGEVSTAGEVYYPIQSGPQRQALSVERLDVGTTLKVRPHRVAENTLLLDVTLATKNLAKTRRTALSVIQRTFQTSVIAQEGKVISIAGLEEEGKERVSRKRTTRRTREEKKKLVLFLQAEKEQSPSRETIASVEAREEIVVQEPGPLHNMELLAFSASLVGKHCALPWLGIGLKWQEDISWRLEGNLLLAPSEGGKGELELRYYPQKNEYLAITWKGLWGEESRSVYSLSFGKEGLLTSHLAWHVRLGYHLPKSQEFYSVLLELSHRKGKLALKGGVKYQWNSRASNLWAQAEGSFALSDKIALVLGYRRRMMGEPFGLSDEMDFEGLYAGISVKL